MTATVSDQPETANYRAPRNLLFLDSAGQCMRKGQKLYGRRLAVAHLEILTSIRRWRVAGFAVALTQRPHSPMANAGSLTIRFRSDRSIGAADEAISV
jgi:hypothetical protein